VPKLFSCHAVDRKVAGPAFKDAAAKYAGDSGAAAQLAAKIQAGGAGV
jgi:cytochrome c